MIDLMHLVCCLLLFEFLGFCLIKYFYFLQYIYIALVTLTVPPLKLQETLIKKCKNEALAIDQQYNVDQINSE